MKKDEHITAELRRVITPAEVTAQRRGSVRLAPGFWLDADGDLHVSVPELLAMVDLEDTPANREVVAGMVSDMLRHQVHARVIITQDEES